MKFLIPALRSSSQTLVAFLSGLWVAAVAAPAHALDKQGSAHGGQVGGDEAGFNVSGGLMLGVSLVNDTYAARPDNTGLALFRYAAHVDLDLMGRALSVPIDLNLFTDKRRRGGLVFAPTEFDVITGLTTTQPVFRGGDLELGARLEHDRPVDQGEFTQTYVDVRSRLLYSLAAVWPQLGRSLVDGDISGYAAFGWFTVNPSYAARPDNTGLALFRYGAHTELSILHDWFSVGVDATMFTDRRASSVVRPSELDWTVELIGRHDPFELHLAYERDMPIDQGGLVQSFVYALAVYNFDLNRDVLHPLEHRATIPSP